jgi:hypothetical protein
MEIEAIATGMPNLDGGEVSSANEFDAGRLRPIEYLTPAFAFAFLGRQGNELRRSEGVGRET